MKQKNKVTWIGSSIYDNYLPFIITCYAISTQQLRICVDSGFFVKMKSGSCIQGIIMLNEEGEVKLFSYNQIKLV